MRKLIKRRKEGEIGDAYINWNKNKYTDLAFSVRLPFNFYFFFRRRSKIVWSDDPKFKRTIFDLGRRNTFFGVSFDWDTRCFVVNGFKIALEVLETITETSPFWAYRFEQKDGVIVITELSNIEYKFENGVKP